MQGERFIIAQPRTKQQHHKTITTTTLGTGTTREIPDNPGIWFLLKALTYVQMYKFPQMLFKYFCEYSLLNKHILGEKNALVLNLCLFILFQVVLP